MGKRDDGSLDLNTRINNLNNVLSVTSKPIIFDADNGGREEHLKQLIHNLERLGISCIVMEDKIGRKINSLLKIKAKQLKILLKIFAIRLKLQKIHQWIKILWSQLGLSL